MDDQYTTDSQLVDALRLGDERAYERLIDLYHESLARMALVYVGDMRVAEEVAQETWLGVLRGLSRFEARSSLKTWIFSILINKAKTFAKREQRHARQYTLDAVEGPSTSGALVSPERFHPPDHPHSPGHWSEHPQSWDDLPEKRLLSQETLSRIEAAINALPNSQREVIVLRDVEQFSSDEVCELLGISSANQRVLLHRARSKVREALENYLSQ